ncbi:MAG: pilus assembly protein PilM, partial [Candidatus Coatesbacteria bacterium]|nr:pilus assembly protein PilM [Candidatus Coatesbacteria bacterium]
MVSLQSSLSILFKTDKVILTHLGKGFSKYTLMDYEVIDLSSSEDNSEDHIDMLIQNGISHFLEEHRIKPDSVSIGIPREDVFFTFAELPKVQGGNLGELLGYEIERHVPLPQDSIFFDAQVVSDGGGQKGMLKVAIIAARRDLIQRYANIIEQINLTASAITISALGLVDFFNQFGEPTENATTALVDCDNGTADLVILKGKELQYCRTIDLNREMPGTPEPEKTFKRPLLGEILKDLGIITDEQLELALAEQRKSGEVLIGQVLFDLGFISEEDLARALSGQANSRHSRHAAGHHAGHVASASGGFEYSTEPAAIQDEAAQGRARAILDELVVYADGNGGSSYIDELYISGEYRSALALQGTLLEQGFSGRVKMLQPHQKMRSLLPPEKASSLCPAIGLGMRDFEDKIKGANLLPTELRASRRLYGKRFMIALSAALCVLLLAVFGSSIAKQTMRVAYLEERIEALSGDVKLVSATRKDVQTWGKLLKELKEISSETLNPLLVLKELDRILPSEGPDKVWITNFRLKGNSLSINGRSYQPEELLAKLEESPLFKNVNFEGRITTGKDAERFGVVLEIDIASQWDMLRPEVVPETEEAPIGPESPEEDMVIGPGDLDE